MKQLIEGVHYIIEDKKIIYLAQYHLDRGHCCGSKKVCRYCPYEPKGEKGSKKIATN